MNWKIVLISAGALLVALIIGPIAWQAGGAIAAAVASYGGLLAALLVALALLAAVGGLRILFAHGRLAAAKARQAEVMTAHGNLIHVDDVTRIAAPHYAHALDRHYDVEAIRAAVPQATHWHQEIHHAPPKLPIDELLSVSTPPAPPLDLAGAIAAGVSTSERWLIGSSADGQTHQVRLHHTGMIAISGQPGSGKTWSAAWLAAQAAAHGGRLFVYDPHAGDDESLSTMISGFSGAVQRLATTSDELNAMIMQLARIYDRRCQNAQLRADPLLLLIDEFMEVMLRRQLDDDAERALTVLSGGGRKKGLYGALISQNWSASAMGQRATLIRQIATGALVHKSDEQTAKFLLPGGYATQAATLEPGAALWHGSGVPVQLCVPALGAADVALAASRQPVRPKQLASANATSAAPPIAPTEPIESVPAPTPREAAPTVRLPAPTVKDQILMLLDARVGQWLTHSEIAKALGIDVGVVQTEAKELYDDGIVARQQCRRGNERVEYAANQFANASHAHKITPTA